MIALKVRQDGISASQQSELGRRAELDYAESMMYSTAGLLHGTEVEQSEVEKPDAYTMQLSAILAERFQ